MSQIDNKYVDVLDDILQYGYTYEDPNRKDTFRKELETVVVNHLREDGYPIVSVRKTYFKGAVNELLLFLKGSTDIRDYWDNGINFWDKDFRRFHTIEDEEFDRLKRFKDEEVSKEFYSMGKIYGHQYKKQYHIFDNFKTNPLRSDLIVNAWNVDELDEMCLKPCHFGFQLIGGEEGFKICWFQRSTDFMLGTPINIQYYFLMGMLLELWSGHKFLGVTGILNKCHLYDNQIKLAQEMIKVPTTLYATPGITVEIPEEVKDLPFGEFIKHMTPAHFKLENYSFVLNESVPMLTYNKDKNEK